MVPNVPRNQALTFAQRTRENLHFIERAAKAGDDVHVVTQLAISLLGLVVFIREANFDEAVRRKKLDSLVAQGWPKWEWLLGPDCSSLDDLVKHLRNSTAHQHIYFISDSPNIEDVEIEVED